MTPAPRPAGYGARAGLTCFLTIQACLRAALPDPAFFPGTVLRGVRPGVVGVEAHAPAASEDSVVALDQLGEASHVEASRGRVV
jgi:hypothetical protein